MCTVLTSLDYYIYQDINVPGCEQFSQAWTIIYINVPGCEQFSQAWTIISHILYHWYKYHVQIYTYCIERVYRYLTQSYVDIIQLICNT